MPQIEPTKLYYNFKLTKSVDITLPPEQSIEISFEQDDLLNSIIPSVLSDKIEFNNGGIRFTNIGDTYNKTFNVGGTSIDELSYMCKSYDSNGVLIISDSVMHHVYGNSNVFTKFEITNNSTTSTATITSFSVYLYSETTDVTNFTISSAAPFDGDISIDSSMVIPSYKLIVKYVNNTPINFTLKLNDVDINSSYDQYSVDVDDTITQYKIFNVDKSSYFNNSSYTQLYFSHDNINDITFDIFASNDYFHSGIFQVTKFTNYCDAATYNYNYIGSGIDINMNNILTNTGEISFGEKVTLKMTSSGDGYENIVTNMMDLYLDDSKISPIDKNNHDIPDGAVYTMIIKTNHPGVTRTSNGLSFNITEHDINWSDLSNINDFDRDLHSYGDIPSISNDVLNNYELRVYISYCGSSVTLSGDPVINNNILELSFDPLYSIPSNKDAYIGVALIKVRGDGEIYYPGKTVWLAPCNSTSKLKFKLSKFKYIPMTIQGYIYSLNNGNMYSGNSENFSFYAYRFDNPSTEIEVDKNYYSSYNTFGENIPYVSRNYLYTTHIVEGDRYIMQCGVPAALNDRDVFQLNNIYFVPDTKSDGINTTFHMHPNVKKGVFWLENMNSSDIYFSLTKNGNPVVMGENNTSHCISINQSDVFEFVIDNVDHPNFSVDNVIPIYFTILEYSDAAEVPATQTLTLSHTISDDIINFTWNNLNNIVLYELLNDVNLLQTDITVDHTTYTLVPGTAYNFQVNALLTDDSVISSNIISYTHPDIVEPEPPTITLTNTINNDIITFNWNSINNVLHYELMNGDVILIDNINTNTISFNNLINGTNYSFKIRAIFAEVEDVIISNAINYTCIDDSQPLHNLSGTYLSKLKKNVVNWEVWESRIGDILYYEIYRGIQLIQRVNKDIRSISDFNIVADSVYTYSIKTKFINNTYSDFTDQVTIYTDTTQMMPILSVNYDKRLLTNTLNINLNVININKKYCTEVYRDNDLIYYINRLVTSYVDHDVELGKEYVYRVVIWDDNNFQYKSNNGYITTKEYTPNSPVSKQIKYNKGN